MARIPTEGLIRFVNDRTAREVKLLLALVLCFVFFLDYLILIKPVQGVFAGTLPQLGQIKEELRGLKEDKKNKTVIEEEWRSAKASLDEAEKSFVDRGEISPLLENLSRLASTSGVKIVSLKPLEAVKTEAGGLYTAVPIKINGLAGTHELGKFLAKLETDRTFFRVTNMKISENPTDVKKHYIELDVEALRKG